MPIGSVWAPGTWEDTAWAEGTWADAVIPEPSAELLGRKLVRRRRKRRYVVENSHEIPTPVVIGEEVVALPPLDFEVDDIDLSALEERADHLEALLERAMEQKASAAREAEIAKLEAELVKADRRIRDERDILAILALVD
jgi:hypothetical protein